MTRIAGRVEIAPGVQLWPEALDRAEQAALVGDVFQRVELAPFYRPVMPGSGKAFSVQESNFGSLGWFSDRAGYRYVERHPVTGACWPAIPPVLREIWDAVTGGARGPECCLVNLYGEGARMGLHQDRDEAALDVPVVSLSLGDEAVFRIGGTARKSKTQSVRLRSGDVLMFGGPARLAFHGIDRVLAGTSTLVPGGGRLNLTLRRVTVGEGVSKQRDARPGG
jgi:alkylated DNA repair protein (DNA oxidative demethylase)